MIFALRCACGRFLEEGRAGSNHRRHCGGGWIERIAIEDRVALFRLHVGPVTLNGCQEWTGARSRKGYGAFYLRGEARANRVAWAIAHGAIPAGMQVLHHCDNPPCVKTDGDEQWPDGHLFLGTNADNKADFAAKGLGKGKPVPWQTGDNNWKRKHPERIPRGPRDPFRTQCKAGHPISRDTDIIRANGGVSCRTCFTERRRAWRQRRRNAHLRVS